jgi:hypothetical protein
LVCNALLSIKGHQRNAAPCLARLNAMRQITLDGKLIWWQQPEQKTLFYGSRDAATVETTALAALALLGPQDNTAMSDPIDRVTAHKPLAWLAGQRDRLGTWSTTQATVLALKALVTGTQNAAHQTTERRIAVELQGRLIQEIVIPT